MKAKFKKMMKNQKGMTLIELLAVIVIIAIIALIAIPAIGNIIQKSQDKAILSDASQMVSGAKIAISDGSCDEDDENNIVCDKDTLEDYVDEAELQDGDSVTKKSDGTYDLIYKKLTNIENENIKKDLGASDKGEVTYKKLISVMGNNGAKTKK